MRSFGGEVQNQALLEARLRIGRVFFANSGVSVQEVAEYILFVEYHLIRGLADLQPGLSPKSRLSRILEEGLLYLMVQHSGPG